MNIFTRFTTTDGILSLLYSLPAIIIALSFHEFAHAYSAYRLGDPTAKNMGRMTISPFAHLDPIGFIFLLVAGFGWAKPVPVNPGNLKHGRYGDLIVSLAGVGTNFVLAFIFAIVWFFLGYFQVQNEVVISIAYYLITFNLALCIFNLLPIQPLDGYHVLKDMTVGPWGGGAFFHFMDRYGIFVLLILVLTGVTGYIFNLIGYIWDGFDYVINAIFSFL